MLKTTKIVLAGFGVTVTGLTVYYFMNRDQEVKSPSTDKQSKKYFDTVPDQDSSLIQLNKILSDNQEAVGKTKGNIDPASIETYENIDKNRALYDSLMKAGDVVAVNEKGNTVENKSGLYETIKAEKFLEKRQVEIQGEKIKLSKMDSLTSSLAEIKTYSSSSIMIEFWESPVNYKGYRLAKNKMILFGVIPDQVQLIRYKSELYLATINNIYAVKACADFCELKPIKDKSQCEAIMRYAN